MSIQHGPQTCTLRKMFVRFQQNKKIQKTSCYYHPAKDISRKGSIDEEILPILNVLNSHDDYLSTSSCSGRISLWVDGIANEQNIEKISSESCETAAGKWLFVAHQYTENLLYLLKSHAEQNFHTVSYNANACYNTFIQTALLYLKVEPLILHIEAGSVKAGQRLVQLALRAGYRNSGMTLTDKRCIVAIRSTLKLDVPVARIVKEDDRMSLHWIVPDDYLATLTDIANEKMNINSQQRHRLHNEITKDLAK